MGEVGECGSRSHRYYGGEIEAEAWGGEQRRGAGGSSQEDEVDFEERRAAHCALPRVCGVFCAGCRLWPALELVFLHNSIVSLSATGEAVVSSVAEIRLSTLAAAYVAVAAFHHPLFVLPGVFSVYKGCLERRTNPFRWFEVSHTVLLACASSPSKI